MPWFLVKVNRFFDVLLRLITGFAPVKVIVYLDPVSKEEADADAELLAGFTEEYIPEWLKRHPILAFFMILFLNFVGKLRAMWKKPPAKVEENKAA